MTYKTKYQLMDSSIVTDKDGNNYPDLATFPIDQIRINSKPREYELTYNDLFKFYNFTNNIYGNYSFYDNLILWLNDITDISDENNFGKKIKIYSKKDIDDWYISNLKGN